ncbi:MAG: hypothetical protein KKD44_29505 [Proteobacteria bacterium]|nr:hypothetical protein [Pseudomonadota bacterium]
MTNNNATKAKWAGAIITAVSLIGAAIFSLCILSYNAGQLDQLQKSQGLAISQNVVATQLNAEAIARVSVSLAALDKSIALVAADVGWIKEEIKAKNGG